MAIVTVTSRNGAKLWDAPNGNVTDTLKFGSQWQYSNTQSDQFGVVWYEVGANQYVDDLEVSESVQSVNNDSGVLTITDSRAVLQYSVNGRSWSGRGPLPVGSQWKYLAVAQDKWGGYNYDLGTNQWVQGAYTNDPENSNSSGGGNMLSIAKSMLGYFTYGGHTVAQIGSVANPNPNGSTDCSGFVWLVMAKAGYNVPSTMFATPAMESDAKGAHNWLKEISWDQTKAGDVFILNYGDGSGSNGHTGILESSWNGLYTPIINMGGNGYHVNEGSYHDACLSLINMGARLTFARPV